MDFQHLTTNYLSISFNISHQIPRFRQTTQSHVKLADRYPLCLLSLFHLLNIR
jgi:hypothetical protein